MKRKFFETSPYESEEPASKKFKETPKSISSLNNDERHSIMQFLSKQDVISNMKKYVPLAENVLYLGKPSFQNFLFVMLGDKDKWGQSDIIKWLSYETLILNGTSKAVSNVLSDMDNTIYHVENGFYNIIMDQNTYQRLISKHHHIQIYGVEVASIMDLMKGLQTTSGIIYPWTFEYFRVKLLTNFEKLFNEYETFHFTHDFRSNIIDKLWNTLQQKIQSQIPFPNKKIKHTFNVFFGGEINKNYEQISKIIDIVNTGFVELEEINFYPSSDYPVSHFYHFLQNLSFAQRLYIRIDTDDEIESYSFLLPIVQLWYQKMKSLVYIVFLHWGDFVKNVKKPIFDLLNGMTTQNIPFSYSLPFCDDKISLEFIKLVLKQYPRNFEISCEISVSLEPEESISGKELNDSLEKKLDTVKENFPHYDILRDAKRFWIYKAIKK